MLSTLTVETNLTGKIAKGDVGKRADHGVVQLDASPQPLIGAPTLPLVEASGRWVDQQRIVRRVELDIGAAQAHQLGHLFAQDVGDRL